MSDGFARLIVLALAAIVLAACQSAPPPAAPAGATTVGDWAVITAGRVRVDSGVVR